jgi:hypothetical protein
VAPLVGAEEAGSLKPFVAHYTRELLYFGVDVRVVFQLVSVSVNFAANVASEAFLEVQSAVHSKESHCGEFFGTLSALVHIRLATLKFNVAFFYFESNPANTFTIKNR